MLHKRKGLSRVLIEIALIVIALAAVGVVYQIFSSSSSTMSSNLRANVDGYLTTTKLVLNVENVGSMPIYLVNATLSPGTFAGSQSTTINPGEQQQVTFDVSGASISSGTRYTVYVRIKSAAANQPGQVVEYVLTMTAQ